MSGRQKSVLVYVDAEGMGGPALMGTLHAPELRPLTLAINETETACDVEIARAAHRMYALSLKATEDELN